MSERQELEFEVGSLYNEYLEDTDKRGTSYGEIAYIQDLSDEELMDMYNELLEYFDNKEV